MFKKISLTLILVVLAAGSVVGYASAQAGAAPVTDPNHRALVGQVQEVGSGEFTVEALNGEVHTIIVTDETVFRNRGDEQAEAASFADLEVGRWVSVLNFTDSAGGFSARLVVLLPEEFDPDALQIKRAFGEVDKINQGQNTFDLTTRAGETLTFSVNNRTRYAGGLTELKDLEKGITIGVAAVVQEDGTLLAKGITNEKLDRQILGKTGGKINAISADSLTIETREGESLDFNLTEHTRVASRDGSVSSLADLETGMMVMVAYKQTDEGTPNAVGILALDQTLLDLERAAGEVQSAGGSQLKLQTLKGETLTFTVDDSTRLKGEGITSLNDIKNGMKALVLYQTEADGSLKAAAILVRVD